MSRSLHNIKGKLPKNQKCKIPETRKIDYRVIGGIGRKNKGNTLNLS